MRPKLIVLVVVLVLVIGGGVTALVLLTRPDEAAGPGRYHPIARTPTSCFSLSDATFKFTLVGSFPVRDGTTALECGAIGRDGENGPVADVIKEVFPDPGGVRTAEDREARDDGTPLSGTGFENDPYVGYTTHQDANGDDSDDCTVEYRRSNEWVELDFSLLPGVSDQASCRKLVMPYARPFYTSIG